MNRSHESGRISPNMLSPKSSTVHNTSQLPPETRCCRESAGSAPAWLKSGASADGTNHHPKRRSPVCSLWVAMPAGMDAAPIRR